MSITPEKRRRDQFKRYCPFVLLLISLLGSSWIFLGEDVRTASLLKSREWKSKTFNYFQESAYRDASGLTMSEQQSNMVFLPDNTYSRDTQITLKNQDENIQIMMSVSESGEWEVSGGYLKLNLVELKDVTTGDTTEFSEKDLTFVRSILPHGCRENSTYRCTR
nr:regulatory protein ToxS [Enterovibrio nigricans]